MGTAINISKLANVFMIFTRNKQMFEDPFKKLLEETFVKLESEKVTQKYVEMSNGL